MMNSKHYVVRLTSEPGWIECTNQLKTIFLYLNEPKFDFFFKDFSKIRKKWQTHRNWTILNHQRHKWWLFTRGIKRVTFASHRLIMPRRHLKHWKDDENDDDESQVAMMINLTRAIVAVDRAVLIVANHYNAILIVSIVNLPSVIRQLINKMSNLHIIARFWVKSSQKLLLLRHLHLQQQQQIEIHRHQDHHRPCSRRHHHPTPPPPLLTRHWLDH